MLTESTIIIADDHSLIRSALVALLDASTGLSVVADVEDADKALRETARHRPDVVVLDIDKEKLEISLGMKQIEVNPWELVAEKYPPGTIIEGTVRNLANYGAFIELEPGIEGLVHVSEMSWTKRVKHPSKVVTIGDEVEAVVLDVDERDRKISLGMKQILLHVTGSQGPSL